jgi:methyl-accepting chemotaxis protein
MVDYTTPVTTAFEMQRATITQSQKALEQSVAFQQNVNEAVIDSLDTQESAQRRGVELSKTAFHSYLDAIESTVPGVAGTVAEMRSAVDEQYDFLLENHAELFDNVESEMVEGVDAYDEMTQEYLDAVGEQVEMLVDAHEELEAQSVEAAEQFGDQLEEVQEQVQEIQAQVEEVQAQAADAVEVDVEA